MADNLNLNPDAIANNRGETGAQPSPSPVKKLNSASTESSSGGKWTVPNLPYGFDLDGAKDMAYKRAENYMNSVLERDDMHIRIENDDESWVGHVSDLNTGTQVNRYEGQDVLKLYAQNFKERGIIVDGRV